LETRVGHESTMSAVGRSHTVQTLQGPTRSS